MVKAWVNHQPSGKTMVFFNGEIDSQIHGQRVATSIEVWVAKKVGRWPSLCS